MYYEVESNTMEWKIFCFEIVIPNKEHRQHRCGKRLHLECATGYRIPLMIYPSIFTGSNYDL